MARRVVFACYSRSDREVCLFITKKLSSVLYWLQGLEFHHHELMELLGAADLNYPRPSAEPLQQFQALRSDPERYGHALFTGERDNILVEAARRREAE